MIDGHVGGDVDELGDVGRREEHVHDVDDLQDRLELAVLVGGDRDALRDADDAQHAHGDLAPDDDHGDPGGHPVLRHEGDERGGDEQLVGEGVEELPERGDLLAPPRHVAVELVGGRGEDEDGGREQVAVGLREAREEDHQEHRDEQDPRDGDAVGEVQLAAHVPPVAATASTSYPRLSRDDGGDEVASAHARAAGGWCGRRRRAPAGRCARSRRRRRATRRAPRGRRPWRPARPDQKRSASRSMTSPRMRGALEGERGGHGAGHAGRGRALLLVVDEDAGDGQAGVAHEADELLELGVGLAGEPGDERGADRGARAARRGCGPAGRGARRRRLSAACGAGRRRRRAGGGRPRRARRAPQGPPEARRRCRPAGGRGGAASRGRARAPPARRAGGSSRPTRAAPTATCPGRRAPARARRRPAAARAVRSTSAAATVS